MICHRNSIIPSHIEKYFEHDQKGHFLYNRSKDCQKPRQLCKEKSISSVWTLRKNITSLQISFQVLNYHSSGDWNLFSLLIFRHILLLYKVFMIYPLLLLKRRHEKESQPRHFSNWRLVCRYARWTNIRYGSTSKKIYMGSSSNREEKTYYSPNYSFYGGSWHFGR